MSPRDTEIQVGLSSEGQVINPSDRLENLWIVREMAAIMRGQNILFFEVSEGMFDSDSKASEFGVTSLFGGRQSSSFWFLF